MTEREKLIELIKGAFDKCCSVQCEGCEYEDEHISARWCQSRMFADFLIANGVRLERKQATSDKTSEWIREEERLPTEPMEYIVVIKGGANATTLLFDGALWFEEDPEGWRTYYSVTHWMPLPDPPKGD